MAFLAIIRDTLRQSVAQVVAIIIVALALAYVAMAAFAVNVVETPSGPEVSYLGLNPFPVSDMEEAAAMMRRLFNPMWFLGVILFIFAASFLITRKLHAGVVELYLSMPVSRFTIIAARCAAITLVFLVPCILNVGGVWLVVGIKTGAYGSGFLYPVLMLLVAGAVITGLCAGLGTAARNAALPAIILCVMWIGASLIIGPMRQIGVLPQEKIVQHAGAFAETNERTPRAAKEEDMPLLLKIVDVTSRYGMPPLNELADIGVALDYPGARVLSWRPVYVALCQAAMGFALALAWFIRKDY